MNYFAHALPFLNRPHFLAGTGVPDWLTVADRQVRIRSRHVEHFLAENSPEPIEAEIAGGVLQHLRDDAQFHTTRAFAETSLTLTAWARDALGMESGMRPALLGHILVELLLDATLVAANPEGLREYYRILDAIEPESIESVVNRMAPSPTRRLGVFVGLFLRERILWDYLEDDKLWVRLNQIMRRVGLAALPREFVALFPAARRLVSEQKELLLAGVPVE